LGDTEQLQNLAVFPLNIHFKHNVLKTSRTCAWYRHGIPSPLRTDKADVEPTAWYWTLQWSVTHKQNHRVSS